MNNKILNYFIPSRHIHTFWSDIRAFLNPRQRWIKKAGYYRWKDKPELIDDFLFECVIHFVEEEDGLKLFEELSPKDFSSSMEYLFYYQKQVGPYREIKEAYEYLKTERKDLIEKELWEFQEAQDKKYAEIIFKNRERLWT